MDVTAHYLFLIGSHCLSPVRVCCSRHCNSSPTAPAHPAPSSRELGGFACAPGHSCFGVLSPLLLHPNERRNENSKCKGHFQRFAHTLDKSTRGPQQPGTQDFCFQGTLVPPGCICTALSTVCPCSDSNPVIKAGELGCPRFPAQKDSPPDLAEKSRRGCFEFSVFWWVFARD